MKGSKGDSGRGPVAPCSGASREGARLHPRVGVVGRVVDLDAYRRGKIAVWALVGLLHEPPWLKDVYLEFGEAGVHVIAEVWDDDVRVLMCLPSSVDRIPVLVRKTGSSGQRRT